VEATGPPPEDFREMTIIPHHDDIFTEKKPYLRKNIVQGAYENLDHYLDVQFRLLREDFLRPLREGIINLVNHGIDQKQGVFKDIRIYRNVKILYPVCSSSGLRHDIQFDNSRLKSVKWENSKRLIFGSLLCLSKDHFQTFIFATVGDRDPKELAHGKLTVQFMDLTVDFSRKNVYEMVETTAYFEAYNPILQGLQQTNDNDLPFQSYLIECNKDIQAPQYLRHSRFALAAPSFDFSSILLDGASPNTTASLQRRFRNLSLDGPKPRRRAPRFKDVPVLDVDRWPSNELLGLDESQYEALKIALTKEVAVIQGPPGTGKTFIGLKIAKLLLSNTKTWIHGEQTTVRRRREVNQTPILVICYTNHALDQFLEGIYDFYGENENKIVRIGGRSKSEKLKECNLRAIKEKSEKKAPRYVERGIGGVHSRLKGVKKKMELSSNVIKKCWQDILYEKTLEKTGVVDEHHFSSLMRPFITLGGGQPEHGSVILKWLNLVAVVEWSEQEELVIFGEEGEFSFNGMQMETRAALPLANVDFSLCVNIKTRQAGNIVSNLPENLRWNDECKALCVDQTAGVIKFISGPNILCESFSRVNDDKWHEIAVVYSSKDNSLALYIDKRVESLLHYHLPEESQQYELKIGMAPLDSGHEIANFVGSMKKFVYYRSTKYNDMVGGDENVEYEIDFIQDQRRIDDDDDKFDSQGVLESDDFGVVDPSKLVQGSGEWQVQNKKRAKKKITFEIRKQLQSEDVMNDEEEIGIRDVWELPVTDRWRLYRKWVTDISQQHQNTIALIQEDYDEGMKELQELYNAKNYELLREAHVIGMTTTGAAKHRNLLHRIKPKITIVEEAAEVLESHIVTALTEGCEHLILIGDHKQLRPKPTVFQLGLDYQLDISLFERMVDNGMSHIYGIFCFKIKLDTSYFMYILCIFQIIFTPLLTNSTLLCTNTKTSIRKKTLKRRMILLTTINVYNNFYEYNKRETSLQIKFWRIYKILFVETPRKFITAKLSIRKPGSSSLLIICHTDEDPGLRIESFAVINLCSVSTNKTIICFIAMQTPRIFGDLQLRILAAQIIFSTQNREFHFPRDQDLDIYKYIYSMSMRILAT
ncbi:NFX1-type zinc finger-containing 1-like, partial [Paramuricea clavata]